VGLGDGLVARVLGVGIPTRRVIGRRRGDGNWVERDWDSQRIIYILGLHPLERVSMGDWNWT
jgi:hypothetical protein